MSVNIVQNMVLDILQKNTALNAEFTSSLTGQASSSGTIVTGTGTLFTTELKAIGTQSNPFPSEYIGNASKGYRKVISITDVDTLEVESAFDSPLNNDSIKKTEIKKGLEKNANLSEVGKLLRVIFVASTDINAEAAKAKGVTVNQARALAMYGFLIAMGFYEPDPIVADERKGNYDKMIRNVIDNSMTFNGTCLGITEMDKLMFPQSPSEQGIYFGTMPLICYRIEIRGNR